jgi:GTP-binding protein
VSHYPAAEFLTSAAHQRQFPADSGAEVAFAGRSNAGKSSAINAIVGHHGLARTSKLPGRTRLLNFFTLSPGCRIVDLPGYGFASASDSERATWAPMIDALAGRECLRGLFLVADIRRGMQDGDRELLDWAAGANLGVHVLLSKADKLGRAELQRALAAARGQLAQGVTMQPFSALRGTGLADARGVLDRWIKNCPGGLHQG